VSLTEGLAQRLQAAGLCTFDATGTTGDTYIETMPGTTPDQAVGLFTTGGIESDSKLPYDEPIVQVRVRGTADPRVSRDRAAAMRNLLHGLSDVALPDGTYLVLAVAVQAAPQSIGVDDRLRHEHVFDLRCEILNASDNRPTGR
jgi:hypothetical protein